MATSTIGSGSRDYATINAWVASLSATLTEAEVGEMYNDSELSGSQTISGITTSASNTLTVTTGSGQSFVDHADIETNALKYNASNGVAIVSTSPYSGGSALTVSTNNTLIEKIQFKNVSGGYAGWALTCSGQTSTDFDRCIVECANRIRIYGPAKMRNTLAVQRGSGKSYIFDTAFGANFYNVTGVVPSDLTAASNAVASSYGSGTMTNCAFFGVSGINGGSTSYTYNTCLTDVGSPPSGWTQVTYGDQFQNTTNASGDWRLKSGADCIDAGTTDSTNAATSINGVSRPSGSSYDVGAWEFVTAGGSYTLTADSGSYAVTGSSVSLLATRLLAALTSSYTTTGTGAGLYVGRSISAGSGSYTLTGDDVSLLATRTLSADNGTYTVTGQDAGVLHGRYLSAESGVYTVTGQDVTTLATRLISAASGSYTLSGTDATLTYSPITSDYVLTANAGSYVLSGGDASLLAARLLSAGEGSYIVTGQVLQLLKGYLLSAEAGGYVATGDDVQFLRTYNLVAGQGSYTIIGSNVILNYSEESAAGGRFITLRRRRRQHE